MRNRALLFSSALIVFSIVIFLYEAHAGARTPEHCGFWTTIDAGLSCR
jgi:hypothetical protein